MTKKSESLFRWLGRQVGYVKQGVKAQVPAVVYRKETVQEAKVQGNPEQKLRRTTVDEVIVQEQSEIRIPKSETNPNRQ